MIGRQVLVRIGGLKPIWTCRLLRRVNQTEAVIDDRLLTSRNFCKVIKNRFGSQTDNFTDNIIGSIIADEDVPIHAGSRNVFRIQDENGKQKLKAAIIGNRYTLELLF